MALRASKFREWPSRLFGATNAEVNERLSYHIVRQTELNIAAALRSKRPNDRC